MDPRLRWHNAVLGLAHPSPPWPDLLAQAGYEVVRIEQPVTTSVGKVTVDLIFAARERNALLAIECKEGTVQAAQADRYQAMKSIDLVRTASITLSDPSAATLDVAYAVPARLVHSTVSELSEHAPRAGVIEIDAQIAWSGPMPTDPRLNAAFATPVVADLRAIPRLMIADDASPASALAPNIAYELLATLESGRESVTVEALIERACWGWPRYGRAFRGQLVRKVEDLLRLAEKHELHEVVTVERRTAQSSDVTVRVRFPASEPLTQAGDLRRGRALRTRFDAFVGRATGHPVPPSPGQLDLLSEFEDADADEE